MANYGEVLLMLYHIVASDKFTKERKEPSFVVNISQTSNECQKINARLS